MTAAYNSNGTTQGVVLHLAFELGWAHWKLAFTVGHGQKPRQRTIRARDLSALDQEIAKAKKRFGLASEAPVFSCYEAGRDGFWLHRYLLARGMKRIGVSSVFRLFSLDGRAAVGVCQGRGMRRCAWTTTLSHRGDR